MITIIYLVALILVIVNLYKKESAQAPLINFIGSALIMTISSWYLTIVLGILTTLAFILAMVFLWLINEFEKNNGSSDF